MLWLVRVRVGTGRRCHRRGGKGANVLHSNAVTHTRGACFVFTCLSTNVVDANNYGEELVISQTDRKKCVSAYQDFHCAGGIITEEV